MKTIITAIVAAAAKLEMQKVKFSYDKLKTRIQEKLGDENEVSKAINELERKPASHARVEVLKEEIGAKALENDAEISLLANELLEVVNEQQPGDAMTVNQEISGTGDATASREGAK